jgi:hypothetical protein
MAGASNVSGGSIQPNAVLGCRNQKACMPKEKKLQPPLLRYLIQFPGWFDIASQKEFDPLCLLLIN